MILRLASINFKATIVSLASILHGKILIVKSGKYDTETRIKLMSKECHWLLLHVSNNSNSSVSISDSRCDVKKTEIIPVKFCKFFHYHTLFTSTFPTKPTKFRKAAIFIRLTIRTYLSDNATYRI